MNTSTNYFHLVVASALQIVTNHSPASLGLSWASKPGIPSFATQPHTSIKTANNQNQEAQTRRMVWEGQKSPTETYVKRGSLGDRSMLCSPVCSVFPLINFISSSLFNECNPPQAHTLHQPVPGNYLPLPIIKALTNKQAAPHFTHTSM